MNATSPARRNRSLRIDKPTYPVAGICEHCGQHFLSRNENPEIAEQHIREQFDAHKCEVKSNKSDTTTES